MVTSSTPRDRVCLQRPRFIHHKGIINHRPASLTSVIIGISCLSLLTWSLYLTTRLLFNSISSCLGKQCKFTIDLAISVKEKNPISVIPPSRGNHYDCFDIFAHYLVSMRYFLYNFINLCFLLSVKCHYQLHF